MSVDLEYFEQHYAIKHPHLTDHMWEVIEHLQARCPVAHSDAPTEEGSAGGGMWVVTKYEDVLTVLQDWETFSSDYQRTVDADVFSARIGDTPPITTDPPLQRDFRRLLNPHLSPQAVAGHEPQVRHIVTELIDEFIEDGRCDLVSQFAYLEPPRMLYRVLFGIEDEDQLRRSLEYTETMFAAADAAAYRQALAAWEVWIDDFIEERRSAPRRSDVIDALLHGSVGGGPLTHEQVAGSVRLLIMGGFFTTNDATTTTMLQLIQHPEVQEYLRKNPGEIPSVLNETLRLEPPVISLFRVCTRDTELGGQQLAQGDVVLMHFGGANRDPDEFDQSTELQLDRSRNRHLSFGGGPHRCIGSNVARLNLRIVFEELLGRLHGIVLTDGETPRHSPASFGWGLEYLPISFEPGPKLLA